MRNATMNLFFVLLCAFSSQVIAQNFTQNITNYFNQFLEQNELLPQDVQWFVTAKNVSRITGVNNIYFRQVINGIQVYGTESSIHILPSGKVLTATNHFIKNGAFKITGATTPSITAIQAIVSAANQLNYSITESLTVVDNMQSVGRKTIISKGGISLSNIPAQLMYQINDKGELKLAWNISIQEISQQDWWSMRVDASTGLIIEKNNWMVSCAFNHNHNENEILDYNQNLFDIPNYKEISKSSNSCSDCYEVIAIPIESPYYGSRTTELDPANATASPFGWHDTNGSSGAEFTVTRGNNVNAYEDGDNPGYQPDGGATLDFTGYPFSQIYTAANQYEDAAITNLFYWNNIIHDVLYQYGFDEAAGNFQENNYGNGGAGSDSVNAEAQDGSGTCNANFGTPVDGGNPQMQMYVCGDKDGDFDNLVIIHEYGHGISNRLTGGPGTSGCLGNSEQMGEGWSDFYGVIMTIEPGDTGTDARGVGTYLFGQGAGGPGIRPFPYSTDFAVNPQTYDDIKTAVIPHGVGSVWATMLWELTWELVDDHGWDANIYNFTGDTNLDAGNVVAMAIITEGMKLQPCSPGFVDGRDAIFAADIAIYGGVNECTIWDAFAKRGLGVSADQGSSSSVSDGTEAFDTPSGLAAFTAPDDVCANDDVLTGLSGGTPSGGVYSGPGVTDDGNGLTYSFDPVAAGIGVHTIMYEVPSGPCSVASSATDDIEVIAVPPGPATTGVSDFCIGDSVTVTATLGNPSNVIRWYDALTGGNFLFEGTSYTFNPTATTDVYAQENPPGPLSQLVISEITLETPDRFEIQNVGISFDYSGYSIAVSDQPYTNINTMNTITQTLGNMGADSVVDWNDSGGAGYWGNNIWWDNNGNGWIIIIDTLGNVVDSVFWNFTAAEIAGLNITINGFNVTSGNLDWSGNGADFTVNCNNSFRRNGDTDSNADWSGTCEASDYGIPNSDIDLGIAGCIGVRTITTVTLDGIDPLITCPVDITVSTDAGQCDASSVNLGSPTVSDNCTGEIVTNDAPSIFNLGSTTVIWTVTDTAGNSSTCSQVVTVVDDIDPIITCPVDITVSTDAGQCDASSVSLGSPTVSDNCTGEIVTNDAPSIFNLGNTTVIWTVTDAAGNSATCSQVVTVVDDLDPTIICPADVTEIVNVGELFTIPDYTSGTSATDNCTASPTITQDPVSGTQVGVGVTVITMTATDDDGNDGTCTFNLTVVEILSIEDLDFYNSIVLYPNPTDGQITLLNNSSIQLFKATIIDINGRVLQSVDLTNTGVETIFSIENLAIGIYFVKINTENISIVKRIVKQ